ncbi:MAG TPA: hypothetical protein VJO52_07795 [Gemmatimonadaceae bacterium]|nr:hypothetical protein [Gemmatimonadaceae bacterium]
MRLFRSTVPLFVGAVLACSSSVAPRAGVTLLVTNETCTGGVCDSLDVVAFPGVHTNTPGGPWELDLGWSTTPQQCFVLPASAQFLIIGVNDNGSRDTTTISWSDAQRLSIGTLPPNAPPFGASPATASFVPAAAAGWAISEPSGTVVRSAQPCHSGRRQL